MANWCDNKIIFASKNKEKINKLFKQLSDWYAEAKKLNENRKENDLSNYRFIGYFFEKYSGSHQTFKIHRTFVEDFDDEISKDEYGWFFEITTYSAWDHQHRCYVEFLKDYDPEQDIEIYHLSEDFEGGAFLNTDTKGRFYQDRFYCYCSNEDKKFTDEQLALIVTSPHMEEESDVYRLAENLFNENNKEELFKTYTLEELLNYFREKGVYIYQYRLN